MASTIADILRLERKLDLLNSKLDMLLEAQNIQLTKTAEQVDKEDAKKRRTRERQQQKEFMRQQFKRRFEKRDEDRKLQSAVGHDLQNHFNLLNLPSGDRIKEYQRTGNPNAFGGLKRRS